ncbi:guanylate kinase [mine drainage metagenome]|uniref:Guanylate kinase n=1 Tax=mine drainage metagenome TaxID=410659 RepID=A0A1J5TAS9_9ZZZZ
MGHQSQTVPVLIVLAGPAGSGKTTLCERLVRSEGGFERVVTATTRPPREGERDGVDYHFLSPEEFDRRIAAGEFLEWAWVHQKNRYGTLASAVLGPLAAGRSLVINVDVQGVNSFRRAAESNALLRRCLVTVFIDLPLEVSRRRLVGRGTDGTEEIERRMRTAAAERLERDRFDFVIESASRDEDYAALLALIVRARARAAGA